MPHADDRSSVQAAYISTASHAGVLRDTAHACTRSDDGEGNENQSCNGDVDDVDDSVSDNEDSFGGCKHGCTDSSEAMENSEATAAGCGT